MTRFIPVSLLLGACLVAARTVPAAAMEKVPGGSEAAPLAQADVLTSLTRDLAAHFNLEGELQLELLRPWTPPGSLASEWKIVVTEYPAVVGSSMLVRCRITADGGRVGDALLQLRAALWREVWFSREPLTPGAVFDPAQLESRRVDSLRERDALPAAVGDGTFIFARSLPAGRLVTWRDVARRPLVRKGDVVDVSAIEGQLAVTLKAMAMENGAQGDVITVRNLDSKKNITAFVIDENHVQVRF
jgi:flagella basal body P-ring formation protein FlgA